MPHPSPTRLLTLALLLIAAMAAAVPAAAAPPAEPFLRVETGMHGGIINRLAIVAEAGEVITASDDKTARAWSIADGSPRAIMRGWVGAADEGALYAVAAHERLVAAGGRTGIEWDGRGSVYFFSRVRGDKVGAIGNLPSAVTSLDFSADGELLAVGLQGGAGLLVYRFRQGQQVLADTDYQDTVTWVDFAPDGRLAVASADGQVRIYNADMTLAARQPLAGGADRPWSVKFSPNGQFLAVGTSTGAAVHILDGAQLTSLQRLTGDDAATGAFTAVAWTPDSAGLYAAGTYRNPQNENAIRRWAGGEATDFVAGSDAVTDLHVLADGRLLYGTAEPTLALIDAQGRAQWKQARQHADFRDAMDGVFRLSADGLTVDFGTRQGGRDPKRLNVVDRVYGPDPSGGPVMTPPQDRAGGVAVTDYRNTASPKINGTQLPLETAELARSAAVAADGSSVVIGTDYYIRHYQGATETWRETLPAPAWAVNISADGRFVVAAVGDGTLRWYRRSNGAPVMSVFAHPDGKRWLAWTPESFFDHSFDIASGSNGANLIGYHLNLDRAGGYTEFVNIEQMYQRYYRRDLVMAKLRGEEQEVVKQAATAGSVGQAVGGGQLPPKIEVSKVCFVVDGLENCTDIEIREGTRQIAETPVVVPENEVLVTLEATDRGGGIQNVFLRRDGTQIPTDLVSDEAIDGGKRRQVHRLAVADGENEILVSAFSANEVEASEEDRALFRIVYQSPDPTDLRSLYVISVGAGAYQNISTLDNPANDAQGIVDMFAEKARIGGVYDKVEAAVLLDADATKANIVAAFDELSAKVRPEDMVVVFLAGHGHNVNGRYHFAPIDIGQGQYDSVEALMEAEGFSQDELAENLAKLQGNEGMVIFDTCYSGTFGFGAGNAVLDPSTYRDDAATAAPAIGQRSGRLILAGVNNEQHLALDDAGVAGAERPDFSNHGLFTAWLLTGMNGKAAGPGATDAIMAAELAFYTKRKVSEVTKGTSLEQTPSFFSAGDPLFPMIPLAR